MFNNHFRHAFAGDFPPDFKPSRKGGIEDQAMSFAKKTVDQIDVKGKRVFVRVDFNVPLDEARNITDDARIVKSLPTIQYLVNKGAKVILASHLGRPKGQRKMEYSQAPAVKRLSELLGKNVTLAPDCIGPDTEQVVAEMQPGDVVMLENLRFHAEEEKNDPEFCKSLAKLADVYVCDAFGTAHRAHASTEGITHFLSPKVAGFLIKKELDYLGGALEAPKRPFIAILGGAKVDTKVGVIENLMKKVDKLLIGGGMSYTFYKAMGYEIGGSLFDEKGFEKAKQLLAANNDKLVLPVDCVVADKFDAAANTKVVKADGITEGWQGVDIGPETIKLFTGIIAGAGTVIWNGPVGVFEMEPFAEGTKKIAKALADSNAVTIIGGGETAAAVKEFGFEDSMSHVSTGGGASLEFLEGIVLPGIAALDEA